MTAELEEHFEIIDARSFKEIEEVLTSKTFKRNN